MDEKDYPDKEEYPIYVGDKEQCSHCSRQFRVNEMVMVDMRLDLVFCLPDFGDPKSCIIQGTIQLGQIIAASIMRFHGNT